MALENVATSILTVDKMVAVFEDHELGNVDVEEPEGGVDIDYEGNDDEVGTENGGDDEIAHAATMMNL